MENRKFFHLALAGLLTVTSAWISAQTMRLGHDAPPDAKGNVTHAYSAVFKAGVESATNGDITVDIYPSNQLGSTEERLQQLRSGIIQGSIASLGTLTPIYPDLDMLNLPFAFKDMSAVYAVFDGPFGQQLKEKIEAQLGDVVVLGIADPGGFFAVSNSKKAINKLEDFKGLRIRTMTVPAHRTLMQGLGSESYPLAWSEVYTGLQTGVIDGQMNPIPTIWRAQMYEVQDYVSLTKHLYNPMFFLANKRFFEKLTPEEQDILHQASYEAVIATRGLGRISEALDTLELTEKMKVNAVDQTELDKMKTRAFEVMDEYFENTLSDDGKEMLSLYKAEIKKANDSVYLK